MLGTDPRVARPSRRSGSSATSARSSTRRCGSGRPRPRSPASPAARRPPSAGTARSTRARPIIALTPMLHRLPEVWGEDAGSSTRTTSPPERRDALPAERVPAVRLRAAGVHRAPVRPAGGDAGARDGPAALRAGRPRELPAQDQGDADPQAGGPHDHGAAPDGPDLGIDRAAGGQRRPPNPGRRRWPSRRPTGTARRCWCCSARTSARPRTSPPGSRGTRPTAATPPARPRSTRRSASCPPRARSSS